jgi:hypothetical protein
MHSPWGIEFNVIKETGWTRRYVMWGESWLNVQIMLADAPSCRTKNKEAVTKTDSIEDLENFFNA